jgi:hypothetical protein
MNERLSVSTVAYLAEQEKLAEEKELLEARARMARINERERLEKVTKLKSSLPYSEKLAQEICERISCGELLIKICLDEHLPTMRRVTQWLKAHDEFNALYAESLRDRLNVFEEEVIKIADDATHDFKEVLRNGIKVRVLDGEAIARAKLRVEVRFRHLKAGRPQKWGDISTLNLNTDDPFDAKNMSMEELEKKIADIEAKSRVAGKAA